MGTSPTIFLIPGLGFTAELFKRLDLAPANVQFLEWIDPLKKESISAYALRLAAPILKSQESPIIVGHSFGGIIAQEIAAQLPAQQLILISSIKSKSENTLNFRSIAPLRLHHLFTRKGTLKTFRYWASSFGYEHQEEQELFIQMVSKQSDSYLQWALKNLSQWQGVESNTPIFHVHGDRDKTFPFKKVQKPVHLIKGGNHMMVWNRAEEISELIQRQFKMLD